MSREETLEQEAKEVAARCNQAEIQNKVNDTMKLTYYKEISEETRDRLISILMVTSCGS